MHKRWQQGCVEPVFCIDAATLEVWMELELQIGCIISWQSDGAKSRKKHDRQIGASYSASYADMRGCTRGAPVGLLMRTVQSIKRLRSSRCVGQWCSQLYSNWRLWYEEWLPIVSFTAVTLVHVRADGRLINCMTLPLSDMTPWPAMLSYCVDVMTSALRH